MATVASRMTEPARLMKDQPLYPGLNHLFMPSPTGAIAEVLHEYQQPQAVDSQVIADIARWILAHEGAG